MTYTPQVHRPDEPLTGHDQAVADQFDYEATTPAQALALLRQANDPWHPDLSPLANRATHRTMPTTVYDDEVENVPPPGGFRQGRPKAPTPKATEPQRRFIANLVRDADWTRHTRKGRSGTRAAALDNLLERLRDSDGDERQSLIGSVSADAASPLITRLKALKGGPDRRNRFADACTDCGQQVPAEEGELYKDGGWKVKHWPTCPEVTEQPGRKDRGNNFGVSLKALPAGRYAVEDASAPKGVRFLKVDHPGANTRWSGWVFAKDGDPYGATGRIGSQRPDADLASLDHRTWGENTPTLLKRVMADPKAAAILYGKHTGTCGVCGAVLSDPSSVEAGIGPVCETRL